MAIGGLDHVNVVTRDLRRALDFYVETLGLVEGDRPPFPFPGAWLYAGDRAVVHLVVDDGAEEGLKGALDHIAFEAVDLEDTRGRLEAAGIDHRILDVPGRAIRQIFLHDPHGVKIELNFQAG